MPVPADHRRSYPLYNSGEFVALQKLEVAYGQSEWVDQICVHATSDMDFVIGIVVPSRPRLLQVDLATACDTRSL